MEEFYMLKKFRLKKYIDQEIFGLSKCAVVKIKIKRKKSNKETFYKNTSGILKSIGTILCLN